MKARISMLALFVVVSGAFLYSGITQKEIREESQKRQETGSLIKKELLALQNKEFPSPQRNIFLRQRMSNRGNESIPSIQGNFQAPNMGDPLAQEETETKEMGFNLNYIGYVKSGDRVVALILLAGEAYAVESGDVPGAGLTIGEISPDEIEIIGPDSVSTWIKLEGERP